MAQKSIFKASFEESLNLQDDPLISFALNHFLKEVETEEKLNQRATLKGNLWTIGLAIVFVIGLNWLLMLLSELSFKSKGLNDFLIAPKINMLTHQVFYIFALVWLGLVLLGKLFNQRFILGYRGHFHLFFTYILWLLIEINLLFATFIFPTLGILNSILLSVSLTAIILILFYSRNKSIKECLYGEKEYISLLEKWLDKVLQQLRKYGGFLVLVVAIISFFMRTHSVNLSNSLGILGILGLWLLINILISVFEIYVILPYLLTGVYKLKYSEEYRNWENKTKSEFYGETYLKKHKELLNHE